MLYKTKLDNIESDLRSKAQGTTTQRNTDIGSNIVKINKRSQI